MISITREEYNTLLEIHRKITEFEDTLESGCLLCPFVCEKICAHGALDNVIEQLKNYVHDEVLC